MSVVMQAPSGVTNVTVATSGTTYTPNTAGQINAQNSDVAYLLGLGFTAIGGPATFLANFRNLIDGGDFTVNPWQRNIPGLASGGVISLAISSTVTYFADRFFAVGGASSAILMSQVADTSTLGFNQSLKVSRADANTSTATINLGQVMETANSVRAQGQQLTLSFLAKQGATFSGGALSASVISGTGTNQSAASMVAGSWTGQASSVTGSVSLTTAMTRYSITGNIPQNATQLGVLLSWTPSGTAGTDDSVTINGVQLEIGGSMSAFEHRDAQVELAIAQRYASVIPEPAAGVVVAPGQNTSATAQLFTIFMPVQMLKAPTVTAAVGLFNTNQAGVATALTTLTGNSTNRVNAIGVLANSAGVAGQATALQGGGGSGVIIASADF